MAYHQGSKGATQTKQDESFFVLGVVGIAYQKRLLVEEHRPRFLERNPMLPSVLRLLIVVPLEAKHGHP